MAPEPADRLDCANPDHRLKVQAVARLFWPDGRHKPTTVCATDLQWTLRDSLAEGHPVEVWPPAREPSDPMRWGQWRKAPDCDRCKDSGRFRETGNGITVEAHCGCKRGRRMSELWYASKHGYGHPDQPEPAVLMADSDITPDPLAERLAYYRSRHYRIPDYAGICASDHHKWPCHASVLLDAVEAAVTLATQWRTMPHLALTQEECGEQLLSELASILLGEEAPE